MSPPVGLLVAALLFWGFAIEQSLVGATLAALLAMISGTRQSLSLSERQLERSVDMTSVAVVLVLVVQLLARGLPAGLLVAMAWSPVVLFPLLLIGSINGTVLRWRHLALALRRSTDPDAQRPVRVSPAYLVTTLLAASAANGQRAPWFFWGMAAIVVAWLFFARPMRKRSDFSAFLFAATLAVGMGFFAARSLPAAQTFLQDWIIDSMAGPEPDASRRQTSIGDLGRIKLSDRIAWRVKGSAGSTVPAYLRTGVFTRYAKGTWFVRAEDWQPGPDWAKDSPASIRVVGDSHDGTALIPMPQRAGEISGVGIAGSRVQRSALGLGKITDAPVRLDVRIQVAPESFLAPPTADDLALPPGFATVLERIPELPRFKKMDERDRLSGVTAWFSDNFRYTLFLGDGDAGRRDLERFLTVDRAGHCEYFATATVLILRHFGIPARYVTGYAVQEFSRLENGYLLRDRHAHAWVEAYVDGRWREIDTTPSSWVAEEESQMPVWRPVIDLFSYALDRVKEWRESSPSFSSNLLYVLFGPLLLVVLIWVWRKRNRSPRSATAKAKPGAGELVNSPAAVAYRLLESRFAARGYSRRPEETPVGWLHRVEREGRTELAPADMGEGWRLVDAYYRERYGRR